MRLVDIDKFLSEESPKICRDYDGVGCPEDGYTISQLKNASTANAVLIPETATNGEVVELMFPESKVAANTDKWGNAIVTVVIRNGSGFYFTLTFDWKWWNAPYGKESK